MVMNSLKRYNWHHSYSADFVGTIWFDGICLSSAGLEKKLSSIGTFEQFGQFIKKLRGHFTIIKKTSREYWVATDPVLHYPVFYKNNSGMVVLSDDPMCLLEGETVVPDRQSVLFFLQFGATYGKHTLVEGISLFEPGTVPRLSESKRNTEHYITNYFLPEKEWKYSPGELKDLLDETFSRYIEPYKDHSFVVPLTAGYDSRLIVAMLKKYGIRNVFCFTWGRRGNFEMVTARKVASQLGYDYQFIEYNNQLIDYFNNQEQFFRYMEYAGGFMSMPFLQDYFAVSYLKNEHIIPSDAVFIPGHTGDVYSGSHQRPWFKKMSKSEIKNEIVDHFAVTGFKNKPLKREPILSLLGKVDDNVLTPVQFFDYWDITIRQARFVARSSSVFRFFGYDVLLPLSDQQFIHYFFSAPTEKRYHEKLYRDTLIEYYFRPFSLDFDLKDSMVFRKDTLLVRLLKNNVPQFVKRMYYQLDDVIFYREITGILIDELNKRKKKILLPDFPNKYNSFLIQWYLYFIFGSDYKNFFENK